MDYVIKEAGITMGQLINDYKYKYNLKKVCYTGRLDPMARGKVLLLKEEVCKLMPEYLSKDKIYQFEIVLGIQTDSDDPLEIIENITFDYNHYDVIKKLLLEINNYIGSVEQKFHKYSSKRINGKPLWYYTKNNIDIPEYPTHNVKLNSLRILEFKKRYNFVNWKNIIIKQINSIDKSCDLRQKEIINQWEKLKIGFNHSILVEANVSSGFYIRQFIRDLSDNINFPLMVYDINRIDILI